MTEQQNREDRSKPLENDQQEPPIEGWRAIFPVLFIILALIIVNIILSFILLNNHVFVK